jgi:hypothetical protein
VTPTPPSNINTVFVDEPGVYVRNATTNVFVVNSTGNSTVMLSFGVDEIGDDLWTKSGGVMFIILPNAHSLLTIHSFNVSSDVIDLTSFIGIYSVDDLQHSRRLTTTSNNHTNEQQITIIIQLTSNQAIHFTEIIQYHNNIRDIRIIFASKPEDSSNSHATSEIGPGPLIAGSVIAGSLLLYILYRSSALYYRYSKKLKDKTTNFDFAAASRTNPTYVTFDPQDSWSSTTTGGTNNSSSFIDSSESSGSNHSSCSSIASSVERDNIAGICDGGEEEESKSSVSEGDENRHYIPPMWLRTLHDSTSSFHHEDRGRSDSESSSSISGGSFFPSPDFSSDSGGDREH